LRLKKLEKRLKNPLEILEMVPDPEIPVINIVELGIVREGKLPAKILVK
jgi:ring-1,2-phenylacetyl-CoA epoxidase subunit PaaD